MKIREICAKFIELKKLRMNFGNRIFISHGSHRFSQMMLSQNLLKLNSRKEKSVKIRGICAKFIELKSFPHQISVLHQKENPQKPLPSLIFHERLF